MKEHWPIAFAVAVCFTLGSIAGVWTHNRWYPSEPKQLESYGGNVNPPSLTSFLRTNGDVAKVIDLDGGSLIARPRYILISWDAKSIGLYDYSGALIKTFQEHLEVEKK